jgi:hypothetical protein
MFYILSILSFLSINVSIALKINWLFITSFFTIGALSIVFFILIHAKTDETQDITAQSRLLPLSRMSGNFYVEERLIDGEKYYNISPLLFGLPNPVPASSANVFQNLECGTARIDECTTYTKHTHKILRIIWLVLFFSKSVRAKKDYNIYVYPDTMLS